MVLILHLSTSSVFPGRISTSRIESAPGPLGNSSYMNRFIPEEVLGEDSMWPLGE